VNSAIEVTVRIIKMSELEQNPDLVFKFGELSPEELAQVYALAKAAFTAEDLQRFTEVDEGIPMELLLQELEEAQRHIDPSTA
jgi:hypothetical protein